MKNIYLITLTFAFSLVLLTSCGIQKIESFEECARAGNPVMESYPRQCRSGGNTFIEVVENLPKPCTREYMPVCGEVEVQCFKAPCDPVKKTFPNRCEAENGRAKNIIKGPCEQKTETENYEKEICVSFDGKWLSGSNECEGINKVECEKMGGKYNECASACRNDPKAQICTMQCVLVCEF